jgi:hypothetical protein
LRELEQVVGALNDRIPRRYLVAQALCLAQNLLSRALVAPEVGNSSRRVELVEAGLFGG